MTIWRSSCALSFHTGALLAALSLSSCALSHGPPEGDVDALPASLVGDWTFAAPICDSVNQLVWVTLCPDGAAWLSDFHDLPSSQWQTFPREATAIDERSVHFDPLVAGNAFEGTTLALDPSEDQLVWVERIGTVPSCGAIDSRAERGRPDESFWSTPLPAHPCR